MGINCGIHQADTILLSLCDRHLSILAASLGILHGAVDEDIVRRGRPGSGMLGIFQEFESWPVIPVGNR